MEEDCVEGLQLFPHLGLAVLKITHLHEDEMEIEARMWCTTFLVSITLCFHMHPLLPFLFLRGSEMLRQESTMVWDPPSTSLDHYGSPCNHRGHGP